jgi:hypothetical protein
MKDSRFWLWFVLIMLVVGGALAILFWVASSVIGTVEKTTSQVLQPVEYLGTQVAQVLNPTPTILPDPVTIVHEMRSLSRLETIQFSLEKVITAEVGQGPLASLFGDRLLFVAHGIVIAGIDLAKLNPEDLWVQNDVLYVRLPAPDIFIVTLDNDKSYVYDRDTGILTRGNINLETDARRAAEDEINKAAVEDGILNIASQNAQTYLYRLLLDLGFPEVIFVQPTPES